MLDNVALKDLLGKRGDPLRLARGDWSSADRRRDPRAPMIEATRRGMNANFGQAGQLAGVRSTPGAVEDTLNIIPCLESVTPGPEGETRWSGRRAAQTIIFLR